MFTSVKITLTFLVLFIGEQQDLHYHVARFNEKGYLPLWGQKCSKVHNHEKVKCICFTYSMFYHEVV
jgi:hypothetical protein